GDAPVPAIEVIGAVEYGLARLVAAVHFGVELLAFRREGGEAPIRRIADQRRQPHHFGAGVGLRYRPGLEPFVAGLRALLRGGEFLFGHEAALTVLLRPL